MYMSAANKQSKKAKRVQDLIKNIKIKNLNSQHTESGVYVECS